MADEIIRELWRVKDAIAEEHNRDIDSLVAALKNRRRQEGQRTVNLRAATGGLRQGAITKAMS